MSHEQRSQLIEFLMYRIDPDTRETLAATLPVAYNAYVGREIVTVVSAADGAGASRKWLPAVTEFDGAGHFVKVRKPF
jgi:hypothetical protein